MGFKEVLNQDIKNVFLNGEEFASEYSVESEYITQPKNIMMIFDDDALEDLKGKSQYAKPLSEATKLFFVSADDLGYKPAKNSIIRINKKPYKIIEVSFEEDGMFQIIVGAAI